MLTPSLPVRVRYQMESRCPVVDISVPLAPQCLSSFEQLQGGEKKGGIKEKGVKEGHTSCYSLLLVADVLGTSRCPSASRSAIWEAPWEESKCHRSLSSCGKHTIISTPPMLPQPLVRVRGSHLGDATGR